MALRGGRDKEKIHNLEHQLKRALADYDNLQKRVEGERERITKLGEMGLVIKLLPVLDTLEAASKIGDEKDFSNTSEGLKISLAQFKKILEEEGVEEVETAGHFDPRVHEAVEIVQGQPDGKIVEVVAKGFRIGERILRPARVKVAKKQAVPTATSDEKEAGGVDST